MRADILGLCAACLLLASPARATVAPISDQEVALLKVEAEQDRWQGRHHYLYDEGQQPSAPQTTGQSPMNAQGCYLQPFRMKRSDGSTVIRRYRRCE